jgi:hypothetical protein
MRIDLMLLTHRAIDAAFKLCWSAPSRATGDNAMKIAEEIEHAVANVKEN